MGVHCGGKSGVDDIERGIGMTKQKKEKANLTGNVVFAWSKSGSKTKPKLPKKWLDSPSQPFRDKSIIGEALKAWREERGLKQVDAAKKLGVTKRSLQNWEQGTRRPHPLIEQVLRDRMASSK